MEENRESLPPATGAVIYPPAYPMPQQGYYPVPAARAGRWLRFRRTLRLLVLRLLRGTTIVGRAIRPYAAFVVVIVALLGVIGWMSYLLWGPKEATPTFQRADSLPPASAVESFLEGQQSYNAELMWNAYSAEYQASQLASGASKATLQAQANSLRSRGLKFVRADYIGGVKLDDDRSMYFYTVDLARASDHGRFAFVFTADADGKIVDIKSPFTDQQSSGQ